MSFCQAEPQSREVISILRDIYTDISESDNYWSKYDKFKKFFQLTKDSYTTKSKQISEIFGNISIITTNYDINIESSFTSIGLKSFPGFDFERINENISLPKVKTFYSHEGKGVPVYKLHGSVNWFKSKYAISVDDHIVVNTDNRLTFPNVCIKNYSKTLTPVIIPPSFLKPEFSNIIKRIWVLASKALQKASIVIFIGYSFSPTDTEMKYFFAKSLSVNPRLRKLIIVDPLSDNIISRLKDNTSNYGNNFTELLISKKGYWENLTFKKIMSI